MGTGYMADYAIDKIVETTANVPGDYAEFGVFRARTFSRVTPRVRRLGKMAHGFDSFAGMADPTEMDAGKYPRGYLDVGGVEAFRQLMREKDISDEEYQLWQGYIPDCFSGFPEDVRFSLALIDLDHYQPTVDSVNWLWPRLNAGGVVVFDDFFIGRQDLCSPAVTEFVGSLKKSEHQVMALDNDQLYIMKTGD